MSERRGSVPDGDPAMMKKVLVVAYYFPPMGMGGVQRVLKFVKYFPQFGWEPVVLTVKDVLYHTDDPGLLSEIEGIPIHRSGSFDPLRLAGMWRRKPENGGTKIHFREARRRNVFMMANRLLSAIMVPDSKILWVPHACAAGLRIASDIVPDCVFTTSPPISGHLVGMAIAHRFRIPWIADFRDLWTGDSQGSDVTPLHALINRWTARLVTRKADGIVSVSKSIAMDLAGLNSEKSVKSVVIPNGYDPEDFTNVIPRSTGKLVFTYGGTFNRDIHPGIFLSALSMAFEKNSELKSCVRVRFSGRDLEGSVERHVRQHCLEPWIESIGYQTHGEWIRTMMDSDVLLLFLPKHAPDGMVTGKIYEYLASGKPIVALVPNGQASRIILHHGRGVVVDPDDRESLAGEILRIHELWKRGDLVLDTAPLAPLNGLSRIEQTGTLVHFFESLCRKWREKPCKDIL